MKKTRHTPNQIITKLRKVEAVRAESRTVAARGPRHRRHRAELLPVEAGVWIDGPTSAKAAEKPEDGETSD